MGAALCACTGRSDDDPGLFRVGADGKLASVHRVSARGLLKDDSLLQTQSRTETRELLSDEEREAIRNSVRVIHASGTYNYHQANGYAQYGYAGPPDDHADATESDEIEYYNRLHQQQQNGTGDRLSRYRSSMNQVTAEAFRSKLREQIMSPRSKMLLLVGANEIEDPEEEDDTQNGERGGKSRSEGSDGGEVRRTRSASAVYEVDPALEEQVIEEEEEYFEYIRIIVPPGPCGVVFQPPTGPSMPPTVEGFVRMYDGARGAIENCGLVQKGSTLCAINDLEVSNLPLTEIVRALNLSSHLEREFVFKK